MKVLYVDSDIQIRDYVSMILESGLECEVVEASSGNEALSVLEMMGDDFDFVITELKMKGGNGDVVANYFDSHRKIIPVIWLSDPKNRDSMTIKESLGRNKMNAFIPKPFKDDQFFPILDKVLKEKGRLLSEIGNVEFKEDEWANLKFSMGNDNTDGSESEVEADWSLKKNKNAEEIDLDYSLNKNNSNNQEVADWSLKKNYDNNEQSGDFRKENDVDDEWEILKRNSKKVEHLKEEFIYSAEEKEEKKKKEKKRPIDQQEFDSDLYRRIKVKRLLNFKQCCCDVYIRISVNKYLKVLNQNEDYEEFFINKYIEKNIKYFFIFKQHYLRFEEMFGNLVIDRLDMAQSMSSDVMAIAELAVMDHTIAFAKEFGVNENTANKVRKSIDSNIKNLKKIKGLGSFLEKMMRGNSFLSEHSLMISYIAGQICMQTPWANASAIEKLSMAAILHDAFLEDDRLAKVRTLNKEEIEEFSDEEVEKIKNHPAEAARIITDGESILPDVDNIIIQHHERPDQSGFPRGIGGLNISPLSCIFIIAEDFVTNIYGKKKTDVDFEVLKSSFRDIYNKGNFKKVLESFELMVDSLK